MVAQMTTPKLARSTVQLSTTRVGLWHGVGSILGAVYVQSPTTATVTVEVPEGGDARWGLSCGPQIVALLTGMRSRGGTPSADRSLDVNSKRRPQNWHPISKVYTIAKVGWGAASVLADIATWDADSPGLPPSPMELAMLQPMQLQGRAKDARPQIHEFCQ